MRNDSRTVLLHTFSSTLALNIDHCSSVSTATSAWAKQIRNISQETVLHPHCLGKMTA